MKTQRVGPGAVITELEPDDYLTIRVPPQPGQQRELPKIGLRDGLAALFRVERPVDRDLAGAGQGVLTLRTCGSAHRRGAEK